MADAALKAARAYLNATPSNEWGKAIEANRFAVYSATGVHIGLWSDERTARKVMLEYAGSTIEPLYTEPAIRTLTKGQQTP